MMGPQILSNCWKKAIIFDTFPGVDGEADEYRMGRKPQTKFFKYNTKKSKIKK